jgi:hypothetical protein
MDVGAVVCAEMEPVCKQVAKPVRRRENNKNLFILIIL